MAATTTLGDLTNLFSQSCISEAQKYQGALFRPEKKGQQNNRNQNQNQNQKQQPPKPTVQDVPETTVAVVSAPPAAPSPPSAAPDFEAKPNVFDFYVGQATPNASVVDLAKTVEPSAAVVKYSEGVVETPAKKSKKKDSKAPATVERSDKKRKRLHVDTSASPSVDRDIEMADAQADGPPIMHSGLTGGLVKMTTRDGFFPPTPDMSADNEQETETPVKRRKEGKRKSLEGNMGMALMRAVTGQKVKKAKKSDADERPKAKKAKAITANGEEDDHAVVAYAQPIEPSEMASMLLALVDKGGETQGVSMNKALKRYHRMRAENGGLGKVAEEKELWKALRMKKNDSGDIVLFF